ncbi:MAG: hypothetical protein AAF821_24135 [Cyanobacteria bacterium P01_D01_bin.156]
MSNDWEYWVEQQEEEQQFLRFADHDPYRKSLTCWIDGIENEIWNWHPGDRVLGWMSRLHQELKIGSKSFWARNIYPNEEREQHLFSESRPLRVLDDIIYEVVGSESEAQFDVIILPRSDLSNLNKVAESLSGTAKDMKEECFTEMLEAIATFIEEEVNIKNFVIYREI